MRIWTKLNKICATTNPSIVPRVCEDRASPERGQTRDEMPSSKIYCNWCGSCDKKNPGINSHLTCFVKANFFTICLKQSAFGSAIRCRSVIWAFWRIYWLIPQYWPFEVFSHFNTSRVNIPGRTSALKDGIGPQGCPQLPQTQLASHPLSILSYGHCILSTALLGMSLSTTCIPFCSWLSHGQLKEEVGCWGGGQNLKQEVAGVYLHIYCAFGLFWPNEFQTLQWGKVRSQSPPPSLKSIWSQLDSCQGVGGIFNIDDQPPWALRWPKVSQSLETHSLVAGVLAVR